MAAEKPLPLRQLAIICTCRFAEPICFTVIFPFIIFMIRDFHVGSEANVGFYVGIIASSFALAQLLSGIHWGMLSDRIGRRPVILSGLTGTIISITLFGLSKSYPVALFSRMICGLLNGNVGVLKSMVAELTVDHTPAQRARAFSILPLVSGLGNVIGPILGGMLSNPVQNFPSVFGRGGWVTDFLTYYPYFLPCFISALSAAFCLVFGFFYLEETLDRPAPKKDEQTPLLKGQKSSAYKTCDEGSSTKTQQSLSCQDENNDQAAKKSSPPSFWSSLTPAVLSICLTYSLLSFQAIYYAELFPIWTASSREDGGLGYAANEIGIALAFSGSITLVSQLLIMPRLVQRFGLLRLVRFVMFSLSFIYLTQSFVGYLYYVPDIHGHTQTKFWVWVGLLITVGLKTLCTTISFTGTTILINEAAPRMDTLGAINGFAQCCASATRALGPATCGLIWSASLAADWIPFRKHISFLFLSIVASITFYSSTRLPLKDTNATKNRRNASDEDEV